MGMVPGKQDDDSVVMFMVAPGYGIECGSKFNWPKKKD